ncbi:PREDICTED: transmembrane protein 156 [Mandrillus leucophaeus]|uniref:transmembrane protein 156 n=1 Tax=Mandrillus leucophaeus TaxID=9568 RepID=UPI0005F3B3A3|nr:PREDICTED: transmembrane protein 156 [Mandrillus leucophaeus]
MTKTALLKLFVAIVITFILILPEYFKTPKERTLELSCLEVCLQSNFTYSLHTEAFQIAFECFPRALIIVKLNHFLVLIRRGSMEVKANDFYSPCQHLNFTVAPLVDHLEEYNTTCHLKNHTGRSAIMEDEPSKGKSINHTCRIMEYPNDCIHISLHLEMDVKSHRDKPTSVLLRGSDSEKLRALNVQVISAGTTQRLPLDEVQEVLPPIPEL